MQMELIYHRHRSTLDRAIAIALEWASQSGPAQERRGYENLASGWLGGCL
jgi:hypothetical protein